MQVHAAARRIGVGLGHECRLDAVAMRDALDDALEADRLVAGFAGIRDMAQVHFPLVGAALRERGAGRHALGFAGGRDLRQDVGNRLEVGHRVDLGARFPPARVARARRLGVAGGRALDVHEVELELDGDDRMPAARRIAVEHGRECVPRVAVERPPVVVEHLDLELGDARAHPGRREKSLGNGDAGAVGVAFVKAEAGGLDRTAEDVEREHGSGQEHAPLVNAGEVDPVHPLAAQHAAEIGQQEIDDAHRGAGGEEGLGIRKFVPDEGHSTPGV